MTKKQHCSKHHVTAAEHHLEAAKQHFLAAVHFEAGDYEKGKEHGKRAHAYGRKAAEHNAKAPGCVDPVHDALQDA